MREKLIRDRIPELFDIPAADLRVAADSPLERFLAAKLVEEAREYQDAILQGTASSDSSAVEELADVLEVIRSAVEARGLHMSEVEAVRAEKARERGGFAKKLIWTIPDDLIDAPWVSPESST